MFQMNKKKIIQFLKDNKMTILQVSLTVGAMALLQDVALAASSDAGAFKPITDTTDQVKDFLTGPIPKVIGTAGMAITGASWAFGQEQQVTKKGVAIFTGSAAAVGAPTIIDVATSGAMIASLF